MITGHKKRPHSPGGQKSLSSLEQQPQQMPLIERFNSMHLENKPMHSQKTFENFVKDAQA
jgi:hypothetical protein